MSYYRFAPYVPVAQRRAKAAATMAKLKAKGEPVSPVRIEGRKIAMTFWGKAWCQHIESFSDFSNRLPRGRTYVRNGSVVDLQIHPGRVVARVAGSSLYKVEIKIAALDPENWKGLAGKCSGQIASVIELLQGRLSDAVMKAITGPQDGMFPTPKQISFDCSCPDGAYMCKHVAAVLYGVGHRLDHQPDLLFRLRQVDHMELITQATVAIPVADPLSSATDISPSDLADVFGVEFGDYAATPESAQDQPKKPTVRARKTGASTPKAQLSPKKKSKSAKKNVVKPRKSKK